MLIYKNLIFKSKDLSDLLKVDRFAEGRFDSKLFWKPIGFPMQGVNYPLTLPKLESDVALLKQHFPKAFEVGEVKDAQIEPDDEHFPLMCAVVTMDLFELDTILADLKNNAT